jgi:hypothetical protein
MSASPAASAGSFTGAVAAGYVGDFFYRCHWPRPSACAAAAGRSAWSSTGRSSRGWSAGGCSVGHAGAAGDPVALGPPVSGPPAHPEQLAGPALGPSLLDDQASQAQTLARGQDGRSVEHEDLRVRVVVAFSSSTPRPEVLPSQDLSVRSCGHTSATNVSGQYNLNVRRSSAASMSASALTFAFSRGWGWPGEC